MVCVFNDKNKMTITRPISLLCVLVIFYSPVLKATLIDSHLQALLDEAVNGGLPGVSLRISGYGVDFTGAAGKANLTTGEPLTERHSLYLASLGALLQVLREIPEEQNAVMIVGHNPGLDELVTYLSSVPVPYTESGKLMTTACLAHIKLPDEWNELQGKGELVQIVRPADLT